MPKYDGWALKNKQGSLLIWTVGYTRREVLNKLGCEDVLNKLSDWERTEIREQGCKIVKVKLIEVTGKSVGVAK